MISITNLHNFNEHSVRLHLSHNDIDCYFIDPQKNYIIKFDPFNDEMFIGKIGLILRYKDIKGNDNGGSLFV